MKKELHAGFAAGPLVFDMESLKLKGTMSTGK
jgi:hypothetical protein